MTRGGLRRFVIRLTFPLRETITARPLESQRDGLPRLPFTIAPNAGWIARLARDRAGNTLAMIAAAIAPIMAMVGGGVDMGRSYLAQARLQQACDAGVLAARKRMGSEAAVSGEIPERTGEIGQRFFNVNFRDGAYGSTERRFEMIARGRLRDLGPGERSGSDHDHAGVRLQRSADRGELAKRRSTSTTPMS